MGAVACISGSIGIIARVSKAGHLAKNCVGAPYWLCSDSSIKKGYSLFLVKA
ncbi:hypothetical protein D3C73_981640 [compost metagenome]